jgi:hypothetical protein
VLGYVVVDRKFIGRLAQVRISGTDIRDRELLGQIRAHPS